ncbi:MAG: twin-arginine translocase TatA/TatE family subunit [Streptosporangiales bacterium]|nr:twin-arginine translocase TatA/TatE family subunit [Streptosporangiales bacterium]
MPNLGPTELIIIAVVIMLLFGAKKMPDAARSLGRSMRIFKAETKKMGGEEEEEKPEQASQQRPQASQPQELPPGDRTTVNGQPLGETERTRDTR